MTCAEVRERIGAVLLGEADQEDSSAVRAHLGQCGACRQEEAAQRRVLAALVGVPAPEPCGSRRAATVDAMAQAAQLAHARRWVRRWRWTAAGSLAAAIVVVVVAVVADWSRASGTVVLVSGEVRAQGVGALAWVYLEPGRPFALPARLAVGPAGPAELVVRDASGAEHRLALRTRAEVALRADGPELRLMLDRGEVWGHTLTKAVVHGINGEEFRVAAGEFAAHVAEFGAVRADPDGRPLQEVAERVARATNTHIGTGWLGEVPIRFQPERSDPMPLLDRFAAALEERGLVLVGDGENRYSVHHARRAADRTDRSVRLFVRLGSGRGEAVWAHGQQLVEAGHLWFAAEGGARTLAVAGELAPWRRGGPTESPPEWIVDLGGRLLGLVARGERPVEPQPIR